MEPPVDNGKDNFVTVVSVNSDLPPKCDFPQEPNSGYVTVLTIGDCPKDITEEVLVYRLPGERLGFGLKFEGGTKANEFVKRLFIQSCAPDSPASRVQSSWGKLTEGDEVLEIDQMPVNSMTRIDCVRCLKDSNVVIKLLVRHFEKKEDLPQVISAEKKRTPPPPPPVPPRKIPKKIFKNNTQNEPVPAARQINSEAKKFQSPRSSGRASYSPDVPRRDRRFSDGSLGPPDAEVYVDLFSQESTQSLSESDDTGSSISTVVDRFGSFPTTTTSSLAGSLPSTPTSVQKQLDFTNLLSAYDDDDFMMKINRQIKSSDEKIDKAVNEDGTPLQPPSYFQDAPLSYGNEDMRMNETKSNLINMCESEKKSMNNKYVENHCLDEKMKISGMEDKVAKKPPVPPRSRDLINKPNGYKEIHDENMNISNLPRLVDFVPKSTSNFENPVEIINVFLENERRDTDYLKNDFYGVDDIDSSVDIYNHEIDIYSSKWSLSSQLATIGEVEEEQEPNSIRSPDNSLPIVITENVDNEVNIDEEKTTHNEGIDGKMEALPSDPRQPPDGHEFPDYVEVEQNDDQRENYQDLYSQQLSANEKSAKPTPVTLKSTDSVNWSQNRSSFNDFSNVPLQNKSSLSKVNSVSNSDLSCLNSRDSFDSDEVTLRRTSLEPVLHTRSQSLIDMSTISKQKNDRWTLLAEQRRKGFSKLKGLVIPEHVNENETPAVNIPEIISHTTSTFVLETNSFDSQQIPICNNTDTETVVLPLTSPPWTSTTNNLPKYSPAFKRKSLQVYTTKSDAIKPLKSVTLKKAEEELRLDSLSDSPKSLESITSPTRSDCSFDYVTNSKKQENRTHQITKLHKDLGKSEDESDNDSAVSSSQSSYISRCSPPPSPTRSCEMLNYESRKDDDKFSNRLLKAASVEAINRKNILASAKCRSGKDFKVGSPVIQRKYEEDPSPEHEREERPTVNGQLSRSVVNGVKKPESKSFVTLRPVPNSILNKVPPRPSIRSSSLNNNKSMSVTDLRKSFEKVGTAPIFPQATPTKEPRKSKLEPRANKIDAAPEKNVKSDAEIAKLETAKSVSQKEEKSNDVDSERKNIVLCPEFVGGSIGITLAGGTDYETKEITVHKIRYGSVAYQDGRLKKGDRIISINGKSTANLTHAESVELLKEPVAQFVLVVEDGKEETVSSSPRRSICSEISEPKSPAVSNPANSVTHVITLEKNGAGLGFSIEGGKDSPFGDLPIRIKKIFQGGLTDKSELCVGDELLAINNVSLTNLSRIEAWSLMKKLPDGVVNIHIHR